MTDKHKKPLLLIGMMGTGKTTLGKMLAKKQNLSFADSDQLIVENEGKTIPEIFADKQQGEAYFRKKESKLITAMILDKTHDIIATGGGAATALETMNIAKEHAYIVWIKSPPEDIYARIKNDKNRPLLQVDNPCQALKDLLAARFKQYNQAHVSIDFDDNNPLNTLDQLMTLYKEL